MPTEQGNTDPNGQKPTPIQQAIQTLSLRIPRTVGAGSPIPGQLLNAPGGSALGGNPNAAALLEQIRRMLFGGGGANFGHPGGPVPTGGGVPPGGMPGAPRVTPGSGDVPMPPAPPSPIGETGHSKEREPDPIAPPTAPAAPTGGLNREF